MPDMYPGQVLLSGLAAIRPRRTIARPTDRATGPFLWPAARPLSIVGGLSMISIHRPRVASHEWGIFYKSQYACLSRHLSS